MWAARPVRHRARRVGRRDAATRRDGRHRCRGQREPPSGRADLRKLADRYGIMIYGIGMFGSEGLNSVTLRELTEQHRRRILQLEGLRRSGARVRAHRGGAAPSVHLRLHAGVDRRWQARCQGRCLATGHHHPLAARVSAGGPGVHREQCAGTPGAPGTRHSGCHARSDTGHDQGGSRDPRRAGSIRTRRMAGHFHRGQRGEWPDTAGRTGPDCAKLESGAAARNTSRAAGSRRPRICSRCSNSTRAEPCRGKSDNRRWSRSNGPATSCGRVRHFRPRSRGTRRASDSSSGRASRLRSSSTFNTSKPASPDSLAGRSRGRCSGARRLAVPSRRS